MITDLLSARSRSSSPITVIYSKPSATLEPGWMLEPNGSGFVRIAEPTQAEPLDVEREGSDEGLQDVRRADETAGWHQPNRVWVRRGDVYVRRESA